MAEARRYIAEEASFAGRFSGNVRQTIMASFQPWKTWLGLLLVAGIIGRVLLLSTTNILGFWADSFCAGGDHCRPVPAFLASYDNRDYLVLLIATAAVGFVINTLFRVGISRTGAMAVSSLYDEVTLRTSRLPMTFFDTTPAGRIISRFSSDYGSVFRMAGGPLGEFMCLVFDLILIMALMAVASPWFMPVIIVVVLLNWQAYRFNNPVIRRERRLLSMHRGPAIAHFAETVQGATAIKVYGKGRSFMTRYNALVGRMVIQKFRTLLALMSFNLQMNAITAVVLLFTGILGIALIHYRAASVGAIGVAFTFIMITSTTIQQFFEWLSNMEEALTGVERLDDYLRKPLEDGALLPPQAKFSVGQPRAEVNESLPVPPARPHGPGALEVRNLWLRYREDLPWVLQDISFSIAPREHFAVVGRTGSGKSSLIQALFLLYRPQRGAIAIDGCTAELEGRRPCPPGTIPLEHFRRFLTLIPQEPVLFRGTLRENLLRLATDDGTAPVETSHTAHTSDSEIWDALRQVRIDGWVRKLKGGQGSGLDYRIEERGGNLSMGERQLLCMTRAMLQDARILIMDEATSSVDPASEELLMRALREVLRDRTRIVVAHRLSTIADADRVMKLDGGRIATIGRPDEVLTL